MSLQNTGRFEADFSPTQDLYFVKMHPAMQILKDEQLPEKIRSHETSDLPTSHAVKVVFMSNPFRYGIEFGLITISKSFLYDCYPEVEDVESNCSDRLVIAHLFADSPKDIVCKTFDLVPQNLWTEILISVPSIDADRSLEYQAALKDALPKLDFLVSLEAVRLG